MSPVSKTMISPFATIQSTLIPSLEGIHLAGRILEWQLKNDNQFPTLSDQIKIGEAHGVSGLSDVDYPMLEVGPNGLPLLRQMGLVNRIPLPPELVEHFGHMQTYCKMGLFPLIQRAWLSIDKTNYLFYHYTRGDLSYFDGLSEPIIAVELVQPKPGIFQPHIQYLLCLATTVEIVLLGVSFSGSSTNYEEMHLLPEPLFDVPTDGAYIGTITGTTNGRIFMGAKDGCVYEFFYQGTIQVYDLGTDGQAMTRVAAININTIVQSAVNIARTVDRSSFRPLVGIAPIESSESTNLHLVAITASGVRLYFSTLPWRAFNEATPSSRPATLQLVQVPSPTSSFGLYSHGTKFLATTTASENDVVWTLFNSLFPAAQQLSETQNTLGLDGKTWALAEVTPSHKRQVLPSTFAPPAPEPPLIVTQHAAAPRKFIFLTTQCCHVVTQLRPVDILRQLLFDASGPDSAAVRVFFQVLREDQACATALILACSTSIQDSQLADWAACAFLLLGGDVKVSPSHMAHPISSPASPFVVNSPGHLNSTPSNFHHQQPHFTFSSPDSGGVGTFNPNAISTPQMQPYSPHSNNVGTSSGGAELADYQFSGRHNGLYLYFGRILRPLWLMPLARDVGKPHQPLLDRFVHANINQNGPQSYQSSEKGRLQDAQMQERKSLLAMKQLLDHTVEVLALWKVLCDHQLHLLGQSLSAEMRMSLKTTLFRDLILSGSDTCIGLINALIHRYLDDAASTDAISEKLRQVCPSLYRNEDALCTKVNEQLLKARTTTMSRMDKERLLQQTLETCKQIPARINLAHVCQQLSACQYFGGVVELCCVVAEKLDPQHRAQQCYSGQQEDPAAVEALLARKNCYQQMCLVLQKLYTAAACHPQSPSVPKSPGPMVQTTPQGYEEGLSPLEAQRLADETLSLALQSDDELCHVAIFDWLTDNKWDDKLLEIQSPHLENYLKRQTVGQVGQQQQTDLVAKYDLLWKFYEKSGQFIAAARVLSRLADAHSTAISLPMRIEYLSRAIVCARAAETSSFGNAVQGQFLYEMEEKMDVAKVQSQVLEAVSRLPSRDADTISRLHSDLLDVTQLYEQFAEPLGLWECKLAILHCANHYDSALVTSIWQNIINAEVKKLGNADTETKLAALSSKMKTLGRTYAQSEQFFPLDFLVKTLETYSVRWNGPPGWVVSIMLTAGVSFQRLFAVYNRLYGAKDVVWQAEGKPNHLLKVLADMLNRLVDSSTGGLAALVPTADRRALIGQCVEAVGVYLTDLFCTTHATSPALIAEFRTLQGKLELICNESFKCNFFPHSCHSSPILFSSFPFV
ncbi:hypothetical protein GHT06_017589 [Daphnia sinensis]|uniref:Nuclear pore complex protein Nup155 n=1 Tax=Daphnia sinensis TaxID=1820382 RepID=A0AAD5PSA1_9CRUS|nr:hypothetical protein GHT06_017589 [Daphnia sinensis]